MKLVSRSPPQGHKIHLGELEMTNERERERKKKSSAPPICIHFFNFEVSLCSFCEILDNLTSLSFKLLLK